MMNFRIEFHYFPINKGGSRTAHSYHNSVSPNAHSALSAVGGR